MTAIEKIAGYADKLVTEARAKVNRKKAQLAEADARGIDSSDILVEMLEAMEDLDDATDAYEMITKTVEKKDE